MKADTNVTSTKVSALWQTLPHRIRDVASATPMDSAPLGACIVTGLGTSEWPARVLEWSMRAQGAACEFVPLSRFVTDAPPGNTLVLFSQYLSNNAALCLREKDRYRQIVLVSALDDVQCRERLSALDVDLPAFTLLTVATPPERNILFRPIGPALMATTGVSRLLQACGLSPLPLEAIAQCYEADRMVNAIDDVPCVVLSVGRDAGIASALAWKANEALGLPVPSWDAIGFAHGGFQAIFDGPKTEVLLLLPHVPSASVIEDGIRAMLAPRAHALRVFRADGVPAPFAYDAPFTRYLLARIARNARDLEAWPGKGCDAAMYNLTTVDAK